MNYDRITNQYATLQTCNFAYGYNRCIFVPSNFTNLGSFYSGLIPAVNVTCSYSSSCCSVSGCVSGSDSSSSCLYIETTDHSYSDFVCDDQNINYDGTCKDSFAPLNSVQKWKLLMTMSSNNIPDISKLFDYNITFNKIYTTAKLSNNLNISVYDLSLNVLLISTQIQILDSSSKTLIKFWTAQI